jgi:hypothetical protein
MISGGVHSGPVSTIRYVGYVGLALHMIILGGLAHASWRLVKMGKGTPYQGLVYLICVPAVIEPFYFVLIYGAFENSFPESLFLLGMIRMFRNTLAEPNTEAALSAATPWRRPDAPRGAEAPTHLPA